MDRDDYIRELANTAADALTDERVRGTIDSAQQKLIVPALEWINNQLFMNDSLTELEKDQLLFLVLSSEISVIFSASLNAEDGDEEGETIVRKLDAIADAMEEIAKKYGIDPTVGKEESDEGDGDLLEDGSPARGD